ncbi:MAG: Stk1 family PASTA domain-containing Ser/Thr kinase [Bacilli bacterium]|nr:Stk1 family PASTA domain-containing Ser/Thr kinase [Bacilli bacterium]MDD4607809.1 Stk1 family PASTA domain-containing Ser/Thr kinase [Bacilli bacterium]
MIIKGQKINERYQIIRTIGEGGMANVYLAHDTILDRNVAVKILRGDLATDDKFVKKFQREAISASSLSHPNIVEMYDVGEDNGQYFIVMEYIDGKTLKTVIKKRGPLIIPEIIDIMLQLTSAIACAHESYIIHRDIKPQNVMILDDGRVKITDFGIAIASNATELTQTNSVMGSVHYLPPEQANGSGATIKSDIYSLGILMFELLTGKVPFKGDNAVEVALKQMKEKIPSVRKTNPDIPQSIENIVFKATAKNPKNRYDSVTEMYEDLKMALDDEKINEERVVYKYPEQELEETKSLPNLTRLEKNLKNDGKEEKGDKKINLALWITGSICFVLLILIGAFVIIFPKLTEVPEVEIPDVAGLSVVDAEKKLKKLGLSVSTDIEEKYDNEIEEGMVITTKPKPGQSVKKNKEVTLILSLGSNTFLLEDYKGQNYFEVKGFLEAKGIYVITKKSTIEDKTAVKENEILEQKPAEGTRLAEGDTVTLYIPDIFTEYPDFRAEGYSVSAIEKFCNEYNISLTINYRPTSQYPAGTIISQSRAAGSKVESGANLIIEVSAEENPEPEVNE